MIAAATAQQRPADARLLHVDAHGHFADVPRSRWLDRLRPGDLVVANDAATMPASLASIHLPTRSPIEVRLAARPSLAVDDLRFDAVVFGEGDWRTRTEHRAPPPPLAAGDRIATPSLGATLVRTLGHPRLVRLRFDASPSAFWEGLARDGRPIQYAHLADDLAMWDVWTPIAGPPVAFEPPSAGFALDWRSLASMREQGIGFATLTHVAGLSSTGDPTLDARLPFDEPYAIPAVTARAIARVRADGGRVVAVGTTVVRALEHAATRNGVVRAGRGVATQRIGGTTTLAAVDAIVTGTHETATSHYDLLRAFADERTLQRMSAALDASGYRTHEFGDSVLLESRVVPEQGVRASSRRRPSHEVALRRASPNGGAFEQSNSECPLTRFHDAAF